MTVVRIPLSTGNTSYGMLWWGMVTLIAALFSFALLSLIGRVQHVASWKDQAIYMVPIFFFLGSLFFHYQALRTRASDGVILRGTEGLSLQIEGGPFSGLRFPLADLDPGRCRIETNHNAYVEAGNHRTYQQHLILCFAKDGRERVVASSMDDAEHASYAAFVETLQSLCAGGKKADPLPEALDPRVIVCPSCHAPVVPADTEVSICRFCGAKAEMTEEVRERLREAKHVSINQARIERRLERLLNRPSAERANRWILATVLCKYLLPFVLLFQFRLWSFTLLLLLALGRVVKRTIAMRVVFRELILDYSATPTGQDGVSLCRCCHGPLPTAGPADVVSRCGFCGAENLRGFDLYQERGRSQNRAAELIPLLLAEASNQVWHAFWLILLLGAALLVLVRTYVL